MSQTPTIARVLPCHPVGNGRGGVRGPEVRKIPRFSKLRGGPKFEPRPVGQRVQTHPLQALLPHRHRHKGHPPLLKSSPNQSHPPRTTFFICGPRHLVPLLGFTQSAGAFWRGSTWHSFDFSLPFLPCLPLTLLQCLARRQCSANVCLDEMKNVFLWSLAPFRLSLRAGQRQVPKSRWTPDAKLCWTLEPPLTLSASDRGQTPHCGAQGPR